ncbi:MULTISPECIES: SAS053 family protein [unclassified Staphylococcus]|uniref:SAS053 family DNA gyrase inhibitor n=1 Tax=unclassified Staphylococcus TaxID=91994 RepID=UPI0019521793|nr:MULTISPECIES: SAS053 family protein [unclassified Staphylococcus]
MTNDNINKKSTNHDAEPQNEMVDDFEDIVELGKEMEQISEKNDEDKLDKSHDSKVRSDLDN